MNIADAAKIICGAAIGAGCKCICNVLAAGLLKNRGFGFNEKKAERAILFAVMAVSGGMIMWLTPGAESIYMFLLLSCLEVLSVTDLHERVIPNSAVGALFAITLLFGIPGMAGVNTFPEFKPLPALAGMVMCFVIFMLPALMSKKVGAGDVKLAAAAGFCLGIRLSLVCIVLMGVFVLAFTVLQNKLPLLKSFKTMIPMGPFLSGAMMTVMILVNISSVRAMLAF